MGESMFSKKKPGTWSASAPVQKSMFKPRGWSKPDTSNHSEEQLDLQTIRDNYAKRPSFIERLAIHPPQPASAGDVETGNIQHQEGEEKPEENLQTKSLADTVESPPELQLRVLPISRFSQYTHNPPSADLDRFFAPAIRSAKLQRQQATQEEQGDENLHMKPLAQVQLQQIEEEKPEEDLQTKPLVEIQRQEPEEEQGDENLQMKSEAQIQLQEIEEEKPEEDLQTKPLTKIQRQDAEEQTEEIQTKLTVGAPGDKYEQEADQMAAKVMAMPEPETPQIQQQAGEEEEVQMKPLAESITPLIQRQTAEGEEQEEVQMLQRKAGGSFSASSNVESSLNASKGGGSPLADNVRGFMELRFGVDFSSVRVHTDSNAVQMNKELGAQAFTHGSHVYYGAGKSPGNNELTAHELTHVVQQTGTKKLQQKSQVALKSYKDILQTKISAAPENLTIQRKQAPKSPQTDPGFQTVVKRTGAVAKQQKAHPPAKVKATEAQAAAVPPSNEKESKAQDRQVQEMSQQQPGQFNAAKFKADLMVKINAATPQNLDQAHKFKDSNKLGGVKSDLSSQMGNEKKQAAEPIEEKTKEPPKAGGIPEKSVTPLPPKPPSTPPADIGAGQAAPKPKDASEVSLQEGSQSLDQQMADAKVTDEQLAKSNEPEFNAALDAKKDAQTDAQKAPAEYRQQEHLKLAQAQATAQATAQPQLQGMQGQKAQILSQVMGQQGATKGQDEQKRSEIANHIQGIYTSTKQKVETLLNSLDGEVNSEFERGASAAKSQFDGYVDQRMKRFKDERYSGLEGKLTSCTKKN